MDRCTKVTLMLIAAALWALVLEHAIGRVEAGSGPQSVQLCDAEGKCALIESGRLLDVAPREMPIVPLDHPGVRVTEHLGRDHYRQAPA